MFFFWFVLLFICSFFSFVQKVHSFMIFKMECMTELVFLTIESVTNLTVIAQDARDDVGGAQNAGMLGILVKTGRHHS